MRGYLGRCLRHMKTMLRQRVYYIALCQVSQGGKFRTERGHEREWRVRCVLLKIVLRTFEL